MFHGYELMDCEEMLEKYEDKALENSAPILQTDKEAKKEMSLIFKHMDRMNFRVNNIYYGKEQPRTPKNLRITGASEQFDEGK